MSSPRQPFSNPEIPDAFQDSDSDGDFVLPRHLRFRLRAYPADKAAFLSNPQPFAEVFAAAFRATDFKPGAIVLGVEIAGGSGVRILKSRLNQQPYALEIAFYVSQLCGPPSFPGVHGRVSLAAVPGCLGTIEAALFEDTNPQPTHYEAVLTRCPSDLLPDSLVFPGYTPRFPPGHMVIQAAREQCLAGPCMDTIRVVVANTASTPPPASITEPGHPPIPVQLIMPRMRLSTVVPAPPASFPLKWRTLARPAPHVRPASDAAVAPSMQPPSADPPPPPPSMQPPLVPPPAAPPSPLPLPAAVLPSAPPPPSSTLIAPLAVTLSDASCAPECSMGLPQLAGKRRASSAASGSGSASSRSSVASLCAVALPVAISASAPSSGQHPPASRNRSKGRGPASLAHMRA